MIKYFSSLCSFYRALLSRSSLSSLIINPLFLRRGRHYFLCVCLSVCRVILGHWGTVIRAKREGGITPYRTRYVATGHAHAHITRLCNGAISGHSCYYSWACFVWGLYDATGWEGSRRPSLFGYLPKVLSQYPMNFGGGKNPRGNPCS